MADAIGIVGLGRMGGGMARRALDRGFTVVGFARGEPPAALVEAGLDHVADLAALVDSLAPPRAILLSIPAGPPVDETLDALLPHLSPGDVVADGGNAYWGDSIARAERLKAEGILFVDLGVSGGVKAAAAGYSFMAGGETEAFARLEPFLRAVAVEGGVVHAGPSGAGHYVKLVHNGIEFGMLQAIGEGFALLRREPVTLDIPAVLESWRHGSVVRGFLMDLLAEAVARDGALSEATGYIEDTGEVNWLVEDAVRMEVPIPVIAQSVFALFASRLAGDDAANAVIAMRHGFGGHPWGPDDAVAEERRTGRVGPIRQPRSTRT
jgi:6-phosphogluconate dehydrogenase